MALTQIKWIRAIGLSFLRDQKRREEKGRGKERRRGRGREEEEEKKKGRFKGMDSKIKYGTMTISMDTCFGL